VGEDEELTRLWRSVDELSAELAPAERRAVRNAIATSVLEGHHPTTESIARLVAFAAGKISAADYLTAVTSSRQDRHC